KDGRTVLATGVPIFDGDHDKITMVVSTSKDVDAVNKLLETVKHQAEQIEKNKEEIDNLLENVFVEENFISADESMKMLKKTLVKIAPLDMAVLVEGETGVGKEIAVRTIHRFSSRRTGPLFKINCGTIPENLIESELFGYEKGAFTGADKGGKKGKLEMAEGGTLFLDEIGEMPLLLQTRLLDFLQEGTFTRVGGTKVRKVDTRVVAATNRNLKKMCNEGTFRKDLYYRLSVIPIKIPPLRERTEDIGAIAKYLLTRFNSKYRTSKWFGEDFRQALTEYNWPGNVRELEHVLERVLVMTENEVLQREDLELFLGKDGEVSSESKVICTDFMPLKEAKWELEKQLVTRAYELYKSTYKVAEVLKIDQSTVVKLLKKHKET
ncbi:MAG: sigma 54-interacting transcriptional regulator, partial [Anaerovoracaceae bacterium]